MRAVVTGASGHLGRQLVPRLLEAGWSCILVGREPRKLQAVFPGCKAIGYDEIGAQGAGCDLLLHLAVLNNNSGVSREEFDRVNVRLAVETCERAAAAGIGRFVFFSSVHALDSADASHYARSKRDAVAALRKVTGIPVEVIYLPAVVGERFSGRLGALNRFPLRAGAARLLGALRPTVHVDRIAEALAAPAANASRIASDDQAGNAFFGVAKRAIDLGFALAVAAFLWWAMILIWLAIRLQSPGPGIFRQIRVGRDGLPFTCYKFRTMFISTPNVATHEVAASAITPIGRFLRRTKLDELPQIANLLRNEMSLVGPRPCLPSQALLVEERRKRGVLTIKPGITGLAQVNGIDMSDPVRLAEWDERYLTLRSLLLDLKIILATIIGKGSRAPHGPRHDLAGLDEP